MSNNVLPLDDLAQRVARQQSDLTALQKELQMRQRQLKELTERKKKLSAQLQQVDTKIKALTSGAKPAAKAPSLTTVKPTPRPAVQPSANEDLPSLSDIIMDILEKQQKPLKVAALTAAVATKKFRTNSRNIKELVKSKVRRLKVKGWLRRAPNKRGVFLTPAGRARTELVVGQPKSKNGAVAKVKVGKEPAKTPAKVASPKQPTAGAKSNEPSLRSLLTTFLKKSDGPVPLNELVGRVSAAGYRSKSKSFPHLVQVTLYKMSDVKHVPQKGYCLIKAKG